MKPTYKYIIEEEFAIDQWRCVGYGPFQSENRAEAMMDQLKKEKALTKFRIRALEE